MHLPRELALGTSAVQDSRGKGVEFGTQSTNTTFHRGLYSIDVYSIDTFEIILCTFYY